MKPPGRESAGKDGPQRPTAAMPESLAAHDIPGFAWWIAGALLRGDLEERRASVLATVLRILTGVGAGGLDDEDALLEIALRGQLMHGQPPRTEEEWERAAQVFSDAAMAEFRRWESGSDGDGENGAEPLFRGKGGAVERDTAI